MNSLTKKHQIYDKKWVFLTNQMNLLEFIATGLIVHIEKYYKDSLRFGKGWLPLFDKSKIPSKILEECTSENNSVLKACILEIDIKTIDGNVAGIGSTADSSNPVFHTFNMANGCSSELDVLLVPLPLPISSISIVLSESKANSESIKNLAQETANKVLDEIKFKPEKKLFSPKANLQDDVLNAIEPPEHQLNGQDYPRVFAYGGALASLFFMTKNGLVSNNVYRKFKLRESDTGEASEDFQIIYNLLLSKVSNITNKLKTTMYEGIIKVLLDGGPIEAKILDYLKNYEGDNNSRERALSLAEDLKSYYRASRNKKFSDYYKDAKTPLEKALLMLFHKSDCEDLFEFDFELAQEEDWILFALLFGIRDKFYKIRRPIISMHGFQNTISLQMANFAHELAGSNCSFDKTDEDSPTVIEMFECEDFKAWYATDKKINCVSTTIKIPIGEYQLEVLKSGLQLVFDGEPKNIKTTICNEKFYAGLGKLDMSKYATYLKHYKKVKK